MQRGSVSAVANKFIFESDVLLLNWRQISNVKNPMLKHLVVTEVMWEQEVTRIS